MPVSEELFRGRRLCLLHIFWLQEYHGMSGKAQNISGGILMCGNNNCGICNWFSGNNWWWIIILLLLVCNCGGNCGSFYNNGCNDNCNCC